GAEVAARLPQQARLPRSAHPDGDERLVPRPRGAPVKEHAMPKPMNRRTMLRGLGGAGVVSLALPPLEAMMNRHGTAYAAGPFPKRFGVWYYGCGITARDRQSAIDNFFPKTPGATWDPPRLLMPLAPHKAYVTVVG